MVYSFDVFDTLITRCTATPQGIFAIMQSRLAYNGDLNDFVKKNFYNLRVGAEQVARHTYCKDGIEDVTLEQIYDVLVLAHHISSEQAVFLQELERQTEVDNICGIPENICRIKELLARKERVILISDMYLDADTIRRMLMKVDCVFEKIPLYVSSDAERKNKYSGNLFKIVREKEQLQYEEWKHFGDNEHSDYRIPQKLGISCELCKSAEVLQIEQEYLKNGEEDAEKQLLIGCAKLARIGEDKNDAFILGCSVGGAVLYPYVKWLLEDATSRGIRRLYFIARDGYVLKEIAEKIVEKKGLQITVKYIYGSRRAWRIPDGQDFKSEVVDIYERSFQDRIGNVTDLADFFQLSEIELKEYLPDNLYKGQRQWTITNVIGILNYLLRLPSFVKLLQDTYLQKKQLLVEYLQQEVDMSDDKFAFVDLAGSGFTQECLAKVMREFYDGTIRNYFYRLDCAREGICQNIVFYPMRVPYYTLLEMMCRAPHEQTIGYEQKADGKIIPIFSKVDGEAILQHQVPNFIKGVCKFTDIYDEALDRYPFLSGTLEHILTYLDYIYNRPDEMILNYFADIPNMLTGREKQLALFAPKLSDQDIKNIFWYREDERIETYYKGSDFPYSLERCTDRQNRKIERYQKYHDTNYGKICRRIHKVIAHKTNYMPVCFHDYVAPNIAIYGAGKLGQQFYRQITGREKVQGIRYSSRVILWMDQNYQEYRKKGLPVSDPQEATKQKYEQLIIAVAKKEVADSIKEMLLNQGVEEYKILWIKQLS